MKIISKTKLKLLSHIFLAIVLVFSAYTTVHAGASDAQYTVLAPLPGIGDSGGTTSLGEYIPALFRLSIGIAGVMAFVMITIGGITYMTSDAISGKSKGRELVTNALYGLILVIGAWVILNTINPKILTFSFEPPSPDVECRDATGTIIDCSGVVAGSTSIAGFPMTQAELDADQAVRDSLNFTSIGPQITVYAGPCKNGQITGCVNMNGIKPTTVSGLQTLRNNCNCNITITGGTEGGHTSGSCHYTGSCVDMYGSTQLNNTINWSGAVLTACTTYTYLSGRYLYEPAGFSCGGEIVSSGDHWHVVF